MERFFIVLFAFVFFLAGIATLFSAESAVHEILSAIFFVIFAIFFVGNALIEAIEKLRDDD